MNMFPILAQRLRKYLHTARAAALAPRVAESITRRTVDGGDDDLLLEPARRGSDDHACRIDRGLPEVRRPAIEASAKAPRI
jgi:hypothetical protein